MKNLILTLGLSLISSSLLASSLQDPQGQLNQIFSYLGRPNFQRDFHCGDKVELHGAGKVAAITMQSVDLVQEIVCTDSDKILRTSLISSQGVLERMGNDTASLFENIQAGEVVLEQEAYEANYKEFILQSLDYLGDSLTVTIHSVYPSKSYGPEDIKIPVMIVEAQVEINDESIPMRFRNLDVSLYFNKDLPAISRMFKIEVGSGKVLFMNSMKGKLEVVSLRRGR